MSSMVPSCFASVRQPFLVCVTIHKARHLSVLNEDTFVLVSFNGERHRTRTFRNSDCPYFNEYFVFEIVTSKDKLIKTSLNIALFHHTCCSKKNRCVGEFTIDLKTIWDSQDHIFLQKWAILEDPSSNEGNAGYLQLDLSIVSNHQRSTSVVIPQTDCDIIQENLLMPQADSKHFQRVKYSISIFRGEFAVKADYAVQVSFGGIKSRTKLAHNTNAHEWNEKLAFIGTFPSLSQMFVFTIIINDCCYKRNFTSMEIPFSQLSKEIDGIYFLPTFGPSYLYLYQGHQNSIYAGRLLLSISTEVIHNQSISPSKCQTSTISSGLDIRNYWSEENFLIKLIILNASVFDSSKPKKIQISLNCLGQSSNTIELNLEKLPISKVCCVNFQESPTQQRPILTVGFKCPDFRWKYPRTMSLHRTLTLGEKLLEKLDLFKLDNGVTRVEIVKDAIGVVLDDLGESLKMANLNSYDGKDKKFTHWDHKWMLYVAEQIIIHTSCIDRLKTSCKQAFNEHDLLSIHRELSSLLQLLKELVHEEQSTFPENLLLIRHSLGRGSCNKTHPDAIHRLNTVEYLHFPSASDVDGTIGLNCAKRCTILPRPFRCQHSCAPEWCGCVYAKFDVAIWVGTEREATEWDKREKPQQKANHRHEPTMSVNCSVNVHQGKIQAGFDGSGLCDPKLVVLFENHEMTTSVIPQTLSPLWNEIIEFKNVKLIEHNDWFHTDTLTLMLLLLDEDKIMCSRKQDELIGIGWANCNLHTRPDGNDTVQDNNHLSPRDQSLLDNSGKAGTVAPVGFESDNLTNSPAHHPQEVSNKMFHRKSKHISATDVWKGFDSHMDTVLRWVGVFQNGSRIADVLMSIQLKQVKQGDQAKMSINLMQGIPQSICPVTKKFRVDVIFTGLREYANTTLTSIGRFRVQVIFGELKLKSGLSCRKSGQSINFLDIYSTGTLMLPAQLEYWPPLIVQHIDCSRINTDRVIGANIIDRSGSFFKEENVESLQKYLIHKRSTYNETERISTDTFFSVEDQPLIETKQKKSSLILQLGTALHAATEMVDEKYKKWIRGAKNSAAITATKRRGSLEAEYSWWTKFYNSCSSQPSDYKHKLKIYPCELENVPEFNYFQDWSMALSMFKKTSHNPMKPSKPYSKLKFKVLIRPTDDQLQAEKSTDPLLNIQLRNIPTLMAEIQIIVVVYIVQGLNLRSRDIFSLSDSYVKLEYGKERIVDRPNYVKDQSNPIFGRRFVLHGRLPRDQLLKISIIDRDTCSLDDLIGTTTVDIEDRFRSRHFASFGIPQEYNLSGYNAWRYPSKPSVLLNQMCTESGIVEPSYIGSTVQIAGISLHDETVISTTENLRERLALACLKNFNRIPVVGCPCVPEHVETRSLFHSDHPGIEQGKLQLWIEMYPSESMPTLVDITPNPPKPYELRVIVWNTQDVILDEKNIFGTKMSDIYVKSWLQDVEDAQFTDIHYRSLDGTGKFNWRMVFPLNYSSSETMMVVTHKKSFYEQPDTEIKVPPLLTVQVWDNDLFSRDDFLGTLNLNLAQLPVPASKPAQCVLRPATAKGNQYFNLFREENVRGWYPIVGKVDNKIVQTGKVELELQTLTEEEALLRPAGKGRKPPQKLPMPDRPDTSFNWYRNPLKSFRMILWPFARKVFLAGFVIILIALLCYGVISHMPESIITKALARKATLERVVRTGITEE